MKKILFTIVTVIIFMLMAGLSPAKEPEYEVTIHVVYNSIPASEIADLVQNQLRKHKDACKVEIKIKNPEDFLQGISNGTYLYNATNILTIEDGDAASD